MAESKMEPRSERGLVGVDVDIVARDDARWYHIRPNITCKAVHRIHCPRLAIGCRRALGLARGLSPSILPTCKAACQKSPCECQNQTHDTADQNEMRAYAYDEPLINFDPLVSFPSPRSTLQAISHPSSRLHHHLRHEYPKRRVFRCRKVLSRVALDLHLMSPIFTSLTSRQRALLYMSSFLAPVLEKCRER